MVKKGKVGAAGEGTSVEDVDKHKLKPIRWKRELKLTPATVQNKKKKLFQRKV